TGDASRNSRGDTRSGSAWNPGPVRDTRSEVTWDAGGCSRDDPSHNTWNTGPVRDIKSRDSRESIVGDRRSDGGLNNGEPSRGDRRSEVAWDASGSNIADRRGPSRDDGKFEEVPGTSNGSSGRSKRPREPSPAPSSTAGPAIRINTTIFETDPSETDNNLLPEDNQDMRDVKRRIEKGDPEITEEMQSLGNCFSFTDPSKALPNVAP
ncbi:unnamed protein product, partial [Allacma fusca]